MLNIFRSNRQQQSSHIANKPNLLVSNNQSGFTLVIVLILSGLASILVLNSLKDNVNQERLSGNFQKQLNARLASEQGIFNSVAIVNQYLSLPANVNTTIADLVNNNVGEITNGAVVNFEGMTYRVDLSDSTATELVLSSVGNRFEGESSLKLRFRITPGGGGAYTSDAVVGCEGVSMAGSGKIDSYNSSVAAYSSDTAGSEGNVSTIDASGADVLLGGGTRILGDINATGSINTSTSYVDGNLHANGDITIPTGGGSVGASGNVLTRGNFTLGGGTIGGYVWAVGNASTTWGTTITNSEGMGLDILYGGTGIFQNNHSQYRNADYNQVPTVDKVKDSDETASDYQSDDPGSNCDYLNIESATAALDDGTSSLDPFTSATWGADYTMDPDGIHRSGSTLHDDTTAKVFENENSKVIKLESFNLLSGMDMTVQGGDVTLYVAGDFDMSGSSKLTIAAGSSLTLIVEGQVNLGAGANIIAEQHGWTDPTDPNGSLPAMRIFSSYSGSGAGVTISGAFNVYAAIYAPLSAVNLAGSGTLYGSVRGKTVSVPGGTAIHYDAALGEGSSGSSGGTSPTLDFVGLSF